MPKYHTTNCRKCGKPFASTGSTVNCPDCRKRSTVAVAESVRTIKVCRCGKTVTSNGVTCPRNCEEN